MRFIKRLFLVFVCIHLTTCVGGLDRSILEPLTLVNLIQNFIFPPTLILQSTGIEHGSVDVVITTNPGTATASNKTLSISTNTTTTVYDLPTNVPYKLYFTKTPSTQGKPDLACKLTPESGTLVQKTRVQLECSSTQELSLPTFTPTSNASIPSGSSVTIQYSAKAQSAFVSRDGSLVSCDDTNPSTNTPTTTVTLSTIGNTTLRTVACRNRFTTYAEAKFTVSGVPTITYNSNNAYGFVQSVAGSLTPVLTNGTFTNFTINPALPSGITIDATTGTISGTSATTSSLLSYTISATVSAQTVTTTLNLAVISVNYPGAPFVLNQNTSMGSSTPTATPGTIVSASATLPASISINPTTGMLSGTPTGFLLTATGSLVNLIVDLSGTNVTVPISVLFTINAQTPTAPVSSNATQTFNGPVNSNTLTATPPTAQIYYTLNGAVPNCTPTGTLYTTGFPLDAISGPTVTLRAIACNGGASSSVTTETFTFQVAIPNLFAGGPNSIYPVANGGTVNARSARFSATTNTTLNPNSWTCLSNGAIVCGATLNTCTLGTFQTLSATFSIPINAVGCKLNYNPSTTASINFIGNSIPTVNTDARIWITKNKFNGNMTISQADTRCNDTTDLNYPGAAGSQFKALLMKHNSAGVNFADPETRLPALSQNPNTSARAYNWVFQTGGIPYYRPSGEAIGTIAPDGTFNGSPTFPNAMVDSAQTPGRVWTGASETANSAYTFGSTTAKNCNSWTSSSSSDLGVVGDPLSTSWTNSASDGAPQTCDQLNSLLCVEVSERKRMFMFSGNSVGSINLPTGGDWACMMDTNRPNSQGYGLFYAMLAGPSRSPGAGPGCNGVNWVLGSNQSYYKPTNFTPLIGTTDANCNMSTLSTTIGATTSIYWTGLNGMTVSSNCTNWTTSSGFGFRGTDSAATNFYYDGGASADCGTAPSPYVCVEQ